MLVRYAPRAEGGDSMELIDGGECLDRALFCDRFCIRREGIIRQ
jgi:hypothetical protein